jgi:hypothetical protein
VKTKTLRHVNGPLSITFIRFYYWEGLKATRLKATSHKLKARKPKENRQQTGYKCREEREKL